MFLQRGYEGATTREIAARRDARSARRVLYADWRARPAVPIFNDDLDAIIDAAIQRLAPGQTLIAQLLAIFRPIYRCCPRNVVIGRYGVHELLLLQAERPEMLGPEARRVIARRERMREALAAVLDRMKADGRIATRERGRAIAELFLWLHWCNVQSWVAAKSPKAASGERALRRIFTTVIRGLGPSRASSDRPSRG